MKDQQKTKKQLIQELEVLRKQLSGLEETSQMWEAMLSSTPDLVYFKDAQHGLKACSQTYAEAVGVEDPASLIGKTALDLWPEEGREILTDEEEVLAGQPMIRKERRVTTADGSIRWYLLTKIPIYQDGNIIGFFAIDKDITERKIAEGALRESESRFRRIFESNMIGISFWDQEGKITRANDAYLNMIGYIGGDVRAGKVSWKDLTPAEYKPLDELAIKEIQATGSCAPYEKEYMHQDGNRIPVLIGGAALEGESHLGLTFAIDISDRKRSENALQESERQLSILMGNLPGMAYRCKNDSNWTMEFISDGCLELTGYPVSDLLKNNTLSYADLIHPEDQDGVWASIQNALEKKKSFEIEYRIITAEGDIKHVWERGAGIYEQDQLIFLEGFISNVTDRKLAQRQNVERWMYLESVLNAAPDAIVTMDAEQRIVEWNPGAQKLFGYSAEEAIGNQLDELITNPEIIDEAVGYTSQVQRGQEILPTEAIRFRKDGSQVEVILAGSPIIMEGKLIGAIGVYTDISDRVRMENELRAMALRDDLTGLYNRRGFSILAEQQLKIASREKHKMLLLYMDLDDLKTINDCYGHPKGDQALQGVGRTLQETFRKSDLIARIGGDEFVVLALESESSSADALLKRLDEKLEINNMQSDQCFQIAVSVGCVQFDPENPCTLIELLDRADQSMYDQKLK